MSADALFYNLLQLADRATDTDPCLVLRRNASGWQVSIASGKIDTAAQTEAESLRDASEKLVILLSELIKVRATEDLRTVSTVLGSLQLANVHEVAENAQPCENHQGSTNYGIKDGTP